MTAGSTTPGKGAGTDAPDPLDVLERARIVAPDVRQGFATASDGTRLYFDLAGDPRTQPTVVLCDGFLCDGFVWKYLRPVLREHYAVLHWNYRGHGRSGAPHDRTRVSMAHIADDLRCVLDALAIERAVIAGHSMGTQVCLEAWRAYPARVRALVLVCGSYGRITRTFHDTDALSRLLPHVIAFVSRHPLLVRGLMSRTPATLAFTLARLGKEIDPVRTRAEDMLPYFEHVAALDPGFVLAMLNAAGSHSAEDLLSAVRTPTLVVAAERDSFTPPRLAQQMARQIAGAEYVMVPEGSHSCPIEQPERVNAAIATFLANALR